MCKVRLRSSSPHVVSLVHISGFAVFIRHGSLALAWFLILWGTAAVASAQTHNALCRNGSGHFEAEFRGVSVRVGAARIGGLATRRCAAILSWDKKELPVAADVAEVDLDAFGVNLGVGVPVVAFQVSNSGAECCPTYQIYSLEKPPRLLRTISGGDLFSAADTDLDDRVEIWTNDAAAINGFEDLVLGELDLAPPVVLRFAHGQLLDVSSEFQPYYDHLITELRKELDSQELRDFKDSDGKLRSTETRSAERLHRLRRVKVKILEIVWSYLYSGRESDAWGSLTELWPAADVDRMHASILSARARGIRTQVDAVSATGPPGRKKRATIFDAISGSATSKSEIVPPQPIMLQRPAPAASETSLTDSELLVDLVIDSAGKVRSIEPAGKAKSEDADLLNAAMEWKFIPAFNGGRAVASRLRMALSARR